jgi:hypothetical protein
MRLASSAREIGCCSRIKFKTICRLTSRGVDRVANRKLRVLILRMATL